MSLNKTDYFKAISSASTQGEREALLRQFDEEVLTPLEENFKSVSSLAALAEQKLGEGYMLTIKAAAKELGMSKKAFVKWLLKEGYGHVTSKGMFEPFPEHMPAIFQKRFINGKTRTVITVEGMVLIRHLSAYARGIKL